MGRPRQFINNQKCERELRLNLEKHKFAILHHNIQGLLKKKANGIISPLKY
jgi:hypothetical protein